MWEWNCECTMLAQALHVGVKKNYCYRTDTRTENLLFEGTADEQNRHKIPLEALTGSTQH